MFPSVCLSVCDSDSFRILLKGLQWCLIMGALHRLWGTGRFRYNYCHVFSPAGLSDRSLKLTAVLRPAPMLKYKEIDTYFSLCSPLRYDDYIGSGECRRKNWSGFTQAQSQTRPRTARGPVRDHAWRNTYECSVVVGSSFRTLVLLATANGIRGKEILQLFQEEKCSVQKKCKLQEGQK
jgi:hypothetical protein